MASDIISPFDVYRGLRKAETGRQLERVFRALSYALHEWCKYGWQKDDHSGPARTRRHGDDAPDGGKMLLIEFDKFTNVICRVWGEMFKATGLKHLDGIEALGAEEFDEMVTFRPPGEEVPGKHGPGTARRVPGTDNVTYFSQMVVSLAEEGFPYFAFEALRLPASRREAPDGPVGTPARKGDYPHMWIVRPGFPVDEDTLSRPAFTNAEIRFLRELANGLKHLGPTEIRALGTHKDSRGTIEEIQRELRWARKICATLVSDLGARRLSLPQAERLRDYAHEATRKALLNHDYYRTGYDTLVRELSNEQLKEAFTGVHKPASVTWDGTGEIGGEAKTLAGLADYVYAVAYFCENPSQLPAGTRSKDTAAARHSFENGLAALRKHGFSGLPESLQGVFEGNSGIIKTTVAQHLSTLLKNIWTTVEGA